ncbi:MAG: hypothetical protein HKN47_11400, partial [Pirellulaceae bacterium]|nr:hypothetical protein [Pirellulaceae bacterium]
QWSDRETELNQTIAELRSSQNQNSESLSQRINDLETHLAATIENLQRAEGESERLAGALAKNDEAHEQRFNNLYAQAIQLRDANKKLDEDIQTKSLAIERATEEAAELKSRLAKLSAEESTAKVNPTTLKKYRTAVAKLKAMYNAQLERRQRAEFAVTQLDRTVTWLEKSSSDLQDQLQREAAARRKAESVIKRRGVDTSNEAASDAVITQIEMDEQIKRLTRELDATRKIRVIERQQAQAAIKKIRNELADSRQTSDQRRAA